MNHEIRLTQGGDRSQELRVILTPYNLRDGDGRSSLREFASFMIVLEAYAVRSTHSF